ncbi:hypothetical protein ACJQWK_00911 [Exserohilum turcicum]|uniref:DUF962-domain-containing protein n=1 Tax=Exserohilum turcicum (strain 28A) TaxID=671987 RepID=R0K3Q0_EXST2|nr:uncharacterized protein SETTUDRAFT_155477 [Exserohilum turcica Et28A]EOA84189.1 hypothetical protein SETTUDRAFT_155477 [Exserohilum turcica Et28A]
MAIFDLRKNLIFYGAYHRDPTNVAIHMTCVPLILGTAFLFGTHTPALPLKPHALLTRLHLPLNLGTLAAATYSTLYVLLSPNVAGVAATPLVMGLASASNYLCTRFNKTKVTAGAVALHTISWILQFVGHGKYEGRKPALLDNLAQALFLAPLFVWYEVLFRLGFYKELHADIMRGVEEEVARMEARKGKGAVKGKGDK